jgi:hypothetical protein
MDLILGSSSADANVRAMAVKALVKSVAGKELSDNENAVSLSRYFNFQFLISV